MTGECVSGENPVTYSKMPDGGEDSKFDPKIYGELNSS